LIGYQKGIFEGIVPLVELLEIVKKIEGIGGIKSPVLEGQKALQIPFLVINDKVVGNMVHQSIQFETLINDRFTLPPSED
jgi:hypothetical protein